MRATSRVILIQKQSFSAARLHKTLAEKLALTDPYPEVQLSAYRSNNSVDSDSEETSHTYFPATSFLFIKYQ